MISKDSFKRVNDYIWEIPQTYSEFMRVPGRIYASEEIFEKIEPDALQQLINVASLPGIVKYSLAMPDIHTGYGFVIGGVAAIDMETGVVSPGGVGYDINCGMKLLKSDLDEKEIRPYLDELASQIQRQVPSGLGKGRKAKLDMGSINRILQEGAEFLVSKGYGEGLDLENCEANGRLESADISNVSNAAKNRGRDQVGTLGSGNHFLEIQKVEAIFDEETARAFGLSRGQIVVMIHTGSRGLGHQIAGDYIRVMEKAMARYNINLPDKELAACPIKSEEGQKYLSAMACGANYAWANRQMITHSVRSAWNSVLGKKAGNLSALYDVAHNIAKIEEYEISGKKTKLCIHRKGATRAFPKGSAEIPEKYRETGQPVLIPGSMGTASYVLVGTEQGKQSFYSTSHGAGRIMSRGQAIRTISGQNTVKTLQQRGIIVKCRSSRGISEEAPQAYKDIDSVADVVHNAGLSKKVARLTPLAVIKGE